jgi:glycerate 2-kinase
MMQRNHAVEIFKSATAAVQPAQLLQEHLAVTKDALVIGGHQVPKQAIRHLYVVGAGKAAAAMAVETEKILGDHIREGLVTTKYDHALPTRIIKILEAAHPVPDEKGVLAVSNTVELLKKATKNDLVLCLISGGASALWCDVPAGMTLQEVQTTFDQLIKSGAAIHEINTVRKHLSGIKGGQLIRHCGEAKVFSLLISDVTGDDLEVIASGPTVADPSTFQDAHGILLKYNLWPVLPQSIRLHIKKGMQGSITETPKPDDPLFSNTINRIIGNNQVAVMAAARKAQDLGYHTHVVPQLITGEAESEAKKLVSFACTYQGDKPLCILQGGETTVRVSGKGKGGRNQHFVLAALTELNKRNHEDEWNKITILSGGTDGTDGPTDAAGAVGDQEVLNLALQKNLSLEAYLKNQDAYHFFEQTNGLLITGPTQTNVMDIMIALVK